MPQDGKDCLEEDLHVQAQTPVIDVAHVQADHFVEVLDVGPATYLPHAGDAVAHGKAALLGGRVVCPSFSGSESRYFYIL